MYDWREHFLRSQQRLEEIRRLIEGERVNMSEEKYSEYQKVLDRMQRRHEEYRAQCEQDEAHQQELLDKLQQIRDGAKKHNPWPPGFTGPRRN